MNEDKSLTVLRRKFLLALPVSAAIGYAFASLVCARFGIVGRWKMRGAKVFSTLSFPIISTAMIAQSNRGEIFRIGNSTMLELAELRRANQGPFSDPQACEKWDQLMANQKFARKNNLDEMPPSQVNYHEIVSKIVKPE